jgi:putative ABC transport system permease protein
MRALLQIRPIIAALRSHKSAVTLLVLEIALTMAILGNLVFIVVNNIERSHVHTGVAENQIGVIQSIGVIGYNNPANVASNLMTLRSVPGVAEAAFGGPPLWSVESDPLFLEPSRQQPSTHVYEFQGSQGLSKTLGVHIVRGSPLTADMLPVAMKATGTTEIPVLITEALAVHLYPQGRALGRLIYDGGTNPMRVVGIIDHLRGQITGRANDDYSLLAEVIYGPQDMGGGFMIRAKVPAHLSQVLSAAAAALQKANPGHVQQKVFTMAELRAKYFRSDLATSHMLMAIMLILLVVTSIGVSGLASFWVQQRRRQIGMRRALGATRAGILHYFQIENFLIVSAGVMLGVVLSYTLNLFLMQRFELPHLPLVYLAVGAIALWILGQLAVLGPAFRASCVPPVVATRSV